MKDRCCNILSIYFNTIELDCFVFHLGKTIEDVKALGGYRSINLLFFFFYLDDEGIFIFHFLSETAHFSYTTGPQCACSVTHIQP